MDASQWHTVSVNSSSPGKEADHISWLELVTKFDRVNLGSQESQTSPGLVCSPMLNFPCLAFPSYRRRFLGLYGYSQ